MFSMQHSIVGGLYHDLGDLFKGHLGCCRSTWVEELACQSFDFAAEAPESHVDLYYFEEPSCAQ